MADSPRPLLMMQVVAVIDRRTTTICLHAAGQMAPPGEPFHTLAGDFYAPPFHVHCRSLVSPWQPGYLSDVRQQANAELQRRPMKQRRIGPDGEGPRLPPPEPGNLPTPPSPAQIAADQAREARIAAKQQQLERLLDAGNQADPLASVSYDDMVAERRRLRQAGDPAADTMTDRWFDAHFQSLPGFEKADAAARRIYSAPDSQAAVKRMLKMEADMRAGRPDTAMVNEVSAWIDRGTLAGDLQVYRGVRLPASIVDALAPGNDFADKAFMSTALERRSAEEYARDPLNKKLDGRMVLFEIVVPKGTHAQYAGALEVVVQRGVEFIVGSVIDDGEFIRVQLLPKRRK